MRRNGGRHPGSRDGVDLRGSASERGSWFGPAARTGLLPSRRTHRRQRMSRGRLGRERRPHALFEAHAPDARNTETCLSRSADDASFTWSSDPCALIATSTPSGQLAEVARWSRYRGRENLGNQEEPAPGSESTNVARLAACHRFRKGEGVAGREKEGHHGARPCEDCESSGLSARTS
jgi:hypothetical protein